jgi:hypothetical protein
MNIQLSPKQSFILWSLLITGDQPMMSKVKPELSPSERNHLVDMGLITLEKRGQAKHIVLTDKAWDWASENYKVEFPTKTTAAVPILQALLQVIEKSLQVNQLSLAEFLVFPKESNEESQKPDEGIDEVLPKEVSFEEKIREAYAKADDGSGSGIRLAVLRQGLSSFPREEVDNTLRQMQLNRMLVLMSMDDPQAIAPEDEDAAIDIRGERCHIVYLKD